MHKSYLLCCFTGWFLTGLCLCIPLYLYQFKHRVLSREDIYGAAVSNKPYWYCCYGYDVDAMFLLFYLFFMKNDINAYKYGVTDGDFYGEKMTQKYFMQHYKWTLNLMIICVRHFCCRLQWLTRLKMENN